MKSNENSDGVISKGEEKVAPDWFFVILAIIFSVLIVYGVGHLQGMEHQYRIDSAPVDARAAATDAVDLCKNAGDRMASCLRRAIATAEKDGHDAQDLTAQQQAAWAGMINVGIGLLSAIGALVGLYWIKATLEATRETLREAQTANGISEKSIRAWIGIKDINSTSCRVVSKTEAEINYSFLVQNFGNYPAFFVSPFGLATDSAQMRDFVLEKSKPFLDKGVLDSGWSDALAPEMALPYRFATIINKSDIHYANHRAYFSLWIVVRYDTNKKDLAYSIFELRVSMQASQNMFEAGTVVKPSVELVSSHMI